MKGEAGCDSSVECRAHARSNLKASVDLPDRALVVKLQSLVAANNDHIASLQAELHQSRKASSKQVSDVQEAYSKKVVALRRESDLQAAAAEADKAKAEAALKTLQDAQAGYQQEIASLRVQVAELQSTVHSSCAERAALQQQISQLKLKRSTSIASSVAPKSAGKPAVPVAWGMARSKSVKVQGPANDSRTELHGHMQRATFS